MKGSLSLALGLLLLIAVWMLSGSLVGSPRAPAAGDLLDRSQRGAPMKVLVRTLETASVVREVPIQGQLEPRRRIAIRAETAGRVIELPIDKGRRVAAGTLLARLAEDDRHAQIARAEAEIAHQTLVVAGHQSLKDRGLQAESQLRAAEAALASARADREHLELDLARTRLTAPFAGVLETRAVELGSLVERGDTLAELIDDNLLLAVGYVAQQRIDDLALGQTVAVRLLDGRETTGVLSYIARVAESGTRSFRVEAEVPNPEWRLPGGVSAELRIRIGETEAHFLSPAALTLDDLGRVGVKTVGADRRVLFHDVAMVRTQADGLWVTGLPPAPRVILQGQGFVRPGETVEAVESGLDPAP